MRKLLYFYTTWCPPCRYVNKNMITPLENKIGSDRIGIESKLQKLNSNEETVIECAFFFKHTHKYISKKNRFNKRGSNKKIKRSIKEMIRK